MQVVESFLSVQGEGKFSGNLAVFVRFAGCNFVCKGFGVRAQKNGKNLVGCDTLRAVFTKEFKKNYSEYNAQELFERVMKLKQKFFPIIVLTGGEPLIHYKNPEFIAFIQALQKEKLQVHFESNGSIALNFEKYPVYKNCVFALSVKLANSGVSKEKRLNFKALAHFKKYAKVSFYKFVLDYENLEQNHKEIQEIVAAVPNEVFCMPMGENKTKLSLNSRKIAEFCVKNGYNYSDRIHIRLWGAKESI
ncbi:7-carboxy-7-deazaguanine synthase QueE [Campylobacter sp. MIT 21-1685]|uniref:7-carboxy-7-deazaguanine synthase QueE n=1 Tax=unclassified Campylobacter TaxID=2593542 RepID=UPI00224B2430|nr:MULTISPECIES: 7-carboxy-7-deazaguanine synthase QueE [unclassified Campylobacter]MCX2682726.1 7-carboxy-7-deazaguanine synthase QueE [Campylobacter sp. MIT 21-1684]MCX2751008.1 7-carboxy-7-deazaguanine synthase QueE [Campylobacter sp. MIT 21-1682]MCX2807061.1 7-carboxy-7-deazaguanine synthase QueE [Campylobacter sp. MIT 21-1685]